MAGTRQKSGSLLAEYMGNYTKAVEVHQSMVALRAAKVEAELAYKARGEFLASMNHELRTPLNAIIGFTSMMKEQPGGAMTDETRQEYFEYILQSADLLLGHINTILEIAAAESGGAKISKSATNPRDLIEAVIQHNSTMAQENGLTFRMSVAEGLPELNIDPDKMLSALNHLVTMAIGHSSKGGHIDLLVQPARKKLNREWVYFAVRDNGVGLTPEQLNRAMHAFEEVHIGLNRGLSSVGLALPIAKSFVELNGGKFSVYSKPGQGTKAQFILPAMHSDTRTQKQSNQRPTTLKLAG
ncbi:MAG: sensor histidine kinase [bacterium]